jgi:hypothetical protein
MDRRGGPVEFTHNPDDDTVTIKLDFEEAIGMYKLALAINHPDDDWGSPEVLQHDEDVGPLSAALVVHLSGVVGP